MVVKLHLLQLVAALVVLPDKTPAAVQAAHKTTRQVLQVSQDRAARQAVAPDLATQTAQVAAAVQRQ